MSLFVKNKILVTHNGTFHADDLFATATLSILFGGDIKIYRTRDPKLIESADIVYDVGGIYDPSIGRFDHHQKEGAGLHPNGIPYSSFGLVWKKFGEQICGSLEVADRIDRKLVQPIDAIDNGVDYAKPLFEEVVCYGPDQAFLNNLPTWKEGSDHIDSIFKKQVKKVVEFLLREIKVTKSEVEAIEIIIKAYESSSNKKIIIIENDFSRYLYQETLSKLPEPTYLILPSGHSTIWKIEAIRKSPFTMENRKPFPESWRGYTNDDPKLKEVTGIPDVSFCHRGGFLAITLSKKGAIKLAEKALVSN